MTLLLTLYYTQIQGNRTPRIRLKVDKANISYIYLLDFVYLYTKAIEGQNGYYTTWIISSSVYFTGVLASGDGQIQQSVRPTKLES